MLDVRDLTAGYAGRPVLRGVSLAARGGESVALLGPNGGGKTTLLRCISGVLRPQGGGIRLADRPLEGLCPRERARLAAVVPQRAECPSGLSVRQMVLLGRYPYLSWLGGYGRRDYAAAGQALAATGAAALAARRVGELSGGELQRVLLARALAQESPLLLLDELAAGLDLARMVELFDLLERRRAAGACVLMAMHDCNLAALYATRLMGLKNGRVLFDGPVSEVFTEERLSVLYDIPIRVFSHPRWGLPQALLGRALPGRGATAPRILLLVLLLAGLNPAPARAAPIEVVDDTGVTLTLDKPATRIIALYGAYNELLLALDARGLLVARTVADAHLPELAGLPAIGTHMRPNAELIVAQKPDLVLQLAGRRECVADRSPAKLGINVLTFEMDSFDKMFDVLEKLGRLTDEGKRPPG